MLGGSKQILFWNMASVDLISQRRWANGRSATVATPWADKSGHSDSFHRGAVPPMLANRRVGTNHLANRWRGDEGAKEDLVHLVPATAGRIED